RAETEFDWARIVPRYQALWKELAERRRAAVMPAHRGTVHPARPDPFRAFAGYPTRFLTPQTQLTLRQAPELLDALLEAPLLAFIAPTLLPAQQMRRILDRAGQGGGASVAELLAETGQSPIAWRSLAWLAKYGLLSVAGEGETPPPTPSSRK